MNTQTRTPVLVALSGGVDSAVVAMLLRKDYDQVIGVSHRHWPESRCCSTACLDRCAEQCRQMGIPYYSVDCIVEFAQSIVDYFVNAYQAGITPNPCVLCNQHIRFDFMLQKFLKDHADLVPEASSFKMATGHYARVENKNGVAVLRKGVDAQKDQSYMLYRLSNDQLARCVFPLGHYKKEEVRALAEQWDLASAKVGDSQDVCFVQTTYQKFLKDYTGHIEQPGDFVDKNGEILGQHQGIAYYSRGQRKGLGLSGGPWYVLHVDPQSRRITLGLKEDLLAKALRIHSTCWSFPGLEDNFEAQVQLRYHGQELSCLVKRTGSDTAEVFLKEQTPDITLGQSAVFYNEEGYVLGGGIIHAILD